MTRPLTGPRNAERLALLDVWAIYRDIQLFRERNVKYVAIECEDFMGAGLNGDPASNDLQSFMPLRAWLGMKVMEVLSVKQSLKPRSRIRENSGRSTNDPNSHEFGYEPKILATFKDGQPAVVSGRVGNGRVIVCGFLPALSYIKPALLARRPLEQKLDAHHAAAKLSASDNNDQPEATNATASSALKAAPVEITKY